MADDEHSGMRGPDDASSASKRRAPPTIDLKQSEYTAMASDAAATADDSASAQSTSDDSRQSDGAPRRRRAFVPVGTAAGAGAVAALIVVGALWSVGLFAPVPPVPPPTASPGDVVARLTRLEQIAAAAKPEEPQPADPVLPARVSALEQSSQTMREQLATLRRQVDTLSSALVELKSARPESGDSSPGPGNGAALEALRARIDGFDRALREVRTSAQTSHETASADRAPDPLADPRLRRFVLALLLDARVRSGASYQSDLASLKALGAPSPMSPAALAALEHFAASGIPSRAALADELRQVLRIPQVPQRRSEAAPPSVGTLGLFDRLSQQAAKLVKIERADVLAAEAGEDVPPALQEAARAGDIGAAMNAMADVDRLPSAMRAPARHWIEKARAADAASVAAQSVLHAAAAPFRAAAPVSP